jgi:protein-S-isoprenylcysteine O-methyltransferase
MGLTLLLVFWASLFDAALRLPVPCGWTAVAGIVLMIIGIAMRYAAIRTLGRFFLNEVALLPNHPLVTHGIYGSLRHPSELGTICLASGGTVLLGSMNGIVICAVVLVPLVIWRTRLEDALLRRRYPLAFHGYSSKVSAFLPMIRPIQSWLDAEM